MARKPQPAEVKRAKGRTPNTDSGGRQLQKLAAVHSLPGAHVTPPTPAGLGATGAALWDKAWAAAINWLSPDSDFLAIEQACRLADDVEHARALWRETGEAQDGRLVVALSKSLADALASLGFDPTSRSRLGVAEVKRVSALDQLIAKRQGG